MQIKRKYISDLVVWNIDFLFRISVLATYWYFYLVSSEGEHQTFVLKNNFDIRQTR